MVYLIEARWRMATSRAWTESRGTCSRPLTRVSCSRRQDTLARKRMDTLKIRSLPSPGIVTSNSTWRNRGKKGQIQRGEVKNKAAGDGKLFPELDWRWTMREKQITRLCSIMWTSVVQDSLLKRAFFCFHRCINSYMWLYALPHVSDPFMYSLWSEALNK